MERPAFQLKIVSALGLVACIALNLWLFRLGPFLGIVGLNISKHVLIAALCQILGVGRKRKEASSGSPTRAGLEHAAGPLSLPAPGWSGNADAIALCPQPADER